jgi:putative ABC transport system permease protein
MRNSAALKMLFHDRATAIGSISGVIVIIFLVGQQLAIFLGLVSYMTILVDNSGADIWIKTKNADNVNAAGTIPMIYLDRIAGIEGIKWVEPIVIGAGLVRLENGNFQAVQIFGTRRPRLVGAPTKFYQGSIGALFDEEGITIDLLDLPKFGNPVIGNILEINGKRAWIRGITQNIQGFSGSLTYTNLEKARELVNMPAERCSNILIKVEDGVDINTMVTLLKQVLPKANAITSKEYASQTRLYYLKNTGIGTSFGLTTLIGTIVGVVIIALTMYTNVLNKIKDYAILRALGARRKDVLFIVFLQSMYIALVGILVGYSLLSFFLISTKGSSLPSYMPWWLAITLIISTLFLCILASVVAMRRAIRIEPASAFR